MRKLDINERIERAKNYSDECKNKEHERIQKALSERREVEEIDKWVERMKFDLFLTADKILEALEMQRDLYAPKSADEPWNERFCNAIQTINPARRFSERCFADCMKENDCEIQY